jgi:hypothetical protein
VNDEGRLHSAPATHHHHPSSEGSNSVRLTPLQGALLACTYLNECELEALLDILAVRYARRFLYRVGAMGTSKELAA